MVVKHYEVNPLAGTGLILWGDLYVLFESTTGGSNTPYPLSASLMKKMLKHKLEVEIDGVGNDMTYAVQLIKFIKNQLASSAFGWLLRFLRFLDGITLSINLAAAVFVAVSILKALKTEDLSRKLEVNYVKFQFRGGLLDGAWTEYVSKGMTLLSISRTKHKERPLRISLTASVYSIWIERNKRLFANEAKDWEIVLKAVINIVRLKLSSVKVDSQVVESFIFKVSKDYKVKVLTLRSGIFKILSYTSLCSSLAFHLYDSVRFQPTGLCACPYTGSDSDSPDEMSFTRSHFPQHYFTLHMPDSSDALDSSDGPPSQDLMLLPFSKRVGPLLAHRLASRHAPPRSSNHHSPASSLSSDPLPVYSLGLDASDQTHSGSSTRDVSPRLCYPPRRAPRRMRQISSLVCCSIIYFFMGSLAPTRANLLPPHKRFRDSYSSKASIEEDAEVGPTETGVNIELGIGDGDDVGDYV
ncbi:hypothetical protein Tco_1136525 [Tanacetum coccineum]